MTVYAPQKPAKFQNQFFRAAVFTINSVDAVASAGAFIPAFQLEPGVIPVDQNLVVTTAFDSATSATVSVGTQASPASFLAATSVKATGTTAIVVPISNTATNGGLTFAIVGATTVGQLTVYVTYIRPYGADFSVGDNQQPTI